jgi:hypothetical protein
MSKGFNWFKQYEIIRIDPDHWYERYELKYLDGGSTSHSAGNVTKVQNLIEKYGGRRIPQIDYEQIDSCDYDLGLIEPLRMVEICNKILSNTECDVVDMRFRIEWFKKLSEDGYYLTYDFY